MAQRPRRLISYKLSETTFRFNNIEPSQELLEQWAAILEKQAKVAASLVLQDGFEIEVVVEEGSIRSAVTLFLSLGLTTLQILGTDYKMAGENILRGCRQNLSNSQTCLFNKLSTTPNNYHRLTSETDQ